MAKYWVAVICAAAIVALGGCGESNENFSSTTPACTFQAGALPADTLPASAPHGDQIPINHIVVLMQENHSFDNYLGFLPYAPNSPYHPGPCAANDHRCLDGLTCTMNGGQATCTNSNPDSDALSIIFPLVRAVQTVFHEPLLCLPSDLDHSWVGAHHEANFADPNNALAGTNDGFVDQNDLTYQPDNLGESPTEDDTMGYYNQDDIPYYYALAETFAVDDRYFSSVLAETIPNRMYLLAGTSFGHLVTTVSEALPPAGGYKPIGGTIYDLLDKNHVSWTEYVQSGGLVPLAYGSLFRTVAPPHFQTLADFMSQAAAGTLPAVSLIDLNTIDYEHPPADIRAGEYTVAQVINAVRSGPNWHNSVIFWTYDENGGFYDHVTPPAAPAPDNIPPGMCADLSNPPSSETPGNGANCADSATEVQTLCAEAMPGEACAGFDQYGFRVPFVAISPFAKPAYVSHTIADHTSILAFIEKRFTPGQHLTMRDAMANDLADMFDFSGAPSIAANVSPSLAPLPSSSDPGCSP